MGDLMLTKFLSARRERRRLLSRRQIRRGLTAVDKRKGLKYQHGDNTQGHKGIGSEPYLPEDIMRHIHTLMPLQDAARAACISHTFLRSWRCYPILTFTSETFRMEQFVQPVPSPLILGSLAEAVELGLGKSTIMNNDLSRYFINKVEHILQNHTGIGVKTLELELLHINVDLSYIDSWLHIAVTPGIEELSLLLPHVSKARYNFPCSILFDRGGNSIQYLHLMDCTFRPTVGLCCMRRLTELHLCFVRITGDELELLLSKSFALECLRISHCHEIVRVTIPCLLQRLNSLQIVECNMLRVIECYAPNVSIFHFEGLFPRISLVNSLLVKNLEMSCMYQSNVVSYARTKLLSMWPNLEALTIHSPSEIENTPMVPGKFLHLKYLHVCFASTGLAFSPAYDYLSLVSFFDASPLLEAFILSVSQRCMKHDSVFEENFHPRQMPEHRHEKLKTVKISGFCSARSMVELTCHILENVPSLKRLTLDTTDGAARCYLGKSSKCTKMWSDIVEANRAILAVKTYIMGKVPPALELNIIEPCSQCHTEIDDWRSLIDSNSVF